MAFLLDRGMASANGMALGLTATLIHDFFTSRSLPSTGCLNWAARNARRTVSSA